MSFISYAQNHEDVMLWRALKNIENGFYIDVGANDPIIDSVTKAFYDRGWSGINIEPIPSHFADLSHQRSRDINLQCAVGASKGEINVWEFPVRGWATASFEVAEQHKASGLTLVSHKVPVTTLEDICTEYAPQEIHFLKIDVEGFENFVIEGANFSLFRPWILVIEATKPNSIIEMHTLWEESLLSKNYVFGYADGLNRFYVAKEHDELLLVFRYPPNVFDAFARAEQVKSDLKVQQCEVKVQDLEGLAHERQMQLLAMQNAIDELTVQRQTNHDELNALHQRLLDIYSSNSWRLTTPLRLLSRVFKRIFKMFTR
jgi:FkbM family methyltransferase